MFHVHKPTNYVLVATTPAIVGTVTTIWWRAIVQAYHRIMPYISMAKTPTEVKSNRPEHFQTVTALGSVGTAILRPGDFVVLAKQRHFLTITITLTTFFVVPFLTPIKNGLVNIVADDTGWDVIVSQTSAIVVAVVYGVMTFCIFCLIIRTWSSHTGLKWDPSPLACQIALIQGSNVAEAFRGFEYKFHQALVRALGEISDDHGILRLGYWQECHDDDDIFYGIRFMKLDGGEYIWTLASIES